MSDSSQPAETSTSKKRSKEVSKYKLGDPLGKGAYSTVYKALNVETGAFVAIKRMKRRKSEGETLPFETNLLKQLQHENVIKYIDMIISESHINLVLEYIESGSLAQVVEKFGVFPESLVAMYMEQVLQGLAYLHHNGIAHRDIKGANILITKDGIVKLADFGIAMMSHIQDNQSRFRAQVIEGSPFWMAPELIKMNSSSTHCDIWSLACTINELLTGFPPYFDNSGITALYRMVFDEHPPFPSDISKDLEDFMRQCWQKDFMKRPSAEELLQHPWIRKARKVESKSWQNTIRKVQMYNTKKKRATLKGLSITDMDWSSPKPMEQEKLDQCKVSIGNEENDSMHAKHENTEDNNDSNQCEIASPLRENSMVTTGQEQDITTTNQSLDAISEHFSKSLSLPTTPRISPIIEHKVTRRDDHSGYSGSPSLSNVTLQQSFLGDSISESLMKIGHRGDIFSKNLPTSIKSVMKSDSTGFQLGAIITGTELKRNFLFSYTVYRIKACIMLPKESAKCWTVLRSHSDFGDLDSKVKSHFASQRLPFPPDFPELPRLRWFGSTEMDYVKCIAALLMRYLKILFRYPVLIQVLFDFLIRDSTELPEATFTATEEADIASTDEIRIDPTIILSSSSSSSSMDVMLTTPASASASSSFTSGSLGSSRFPRTALSLETIIPSQKDKDQQLEEQGKQKSTADTIVRSNSVETSLA